MTCFMHYVDIGAVSAQDSMDSSSTRRLPEVRCGIVEGFSIRSCMSGPFKFDVPILTPGRSWESTYKILISVFTLSH